MVDLSQFFENAVSKKETSYKDIIKKTWHVEYFLFSFNFKKFGFVKHNWYPCGSWENPKAEYDFDYVKGFKLFDKEYKDEVVILEKDNAESEVKRQNQLKHNKSKWYDKWALKQSKWILRVKCIPMLVHKEELIGYIDNEGEYYFDERKYGKHYNVD